MTKAFPDASAIFILSVSGDVATPRCNKLAQQFEARSRVFRKRQNLPRIRWLGSIAAMMPETMMNIHT